MDRFIALLFHRLLAPESGFRTPSATPSRVRVRLWQAGMKCTDRAYAFFIRSRPFRIRRESAPCVWGHSQSAVGGQLSCVLQRPVSLILVISKLYALWKWACCLVCREVFLVDSENVTRTVC